MNKFAYTMMILTLLFLTWAIYGIVYSSPLAAVVGILIAMWCVVLVIAFGEKRRYRHAR